MIERGKAGLNEELRPRGSGTAAILASCGSLVEVFEDEEELRRVRISHYTVQVTMSFPCLHYSTERLISTSGISTTWNSYLGTTRAIPVPFPSRRRTYKARKFIVNLLAVQHVRWDIQTLD